MQGSRRLLILAVCCALASCGYDEPTLSKASLQQTALMPPTVARMVIAQYLGAEWVNAPFVYPDGLQCLFFDKVPIHIMDLDQISYDDLSGHLILGKSGSGLSNRYYNTVFDCTHRGVLSFDGLGPERAHQLVAALIALGAPLDPNLGSGD
jgi:hypothetical protein